MAVRSAILFSGFAFKTPQQKPKVIIKGTTMIETGNEETLFMVDGKTDFKVMHMEGEGEVTIKFIYDEEVLETTLKPGNEIRLLASEGFVSAQVNSGGALAGLVWELYQR